MLHIKNPCMNCENRSVGCHGYCKDYKVYRKELDAKNKLIHDEQRKKRVFDDYCNDVKAKRCKRKSDKVKYLQER